MANTIITAGKKYIDIDAYASMIIYREFLRSVGQTNVYAVSSAKLNSSVPSLIRSLKYKLDSFIATEDSETILVDISNPDFIDDAVPKDSIIKVIDHHTGFEDYWKSKLGVKTQIEFIGSVCTLIFERVENADKLSILDKDLCKLLAAGILDNTLNLRSSNTTVRDIKAYEKILKIGNIPENWSKEYFEACDKEVLKDFYATIKNDLKIEDASPLLPKIFGQVLLSSIDRIDEKELARCFSEYNKWILNVISMEDGKSYIYCDSDSTRSKLKSLLGGQEKHDNLLILDKFLLRKEIMKRARDSEDN